MLQSLAPLIAVAAAAIVGADRRIVTELRATRATAHDRAVELRSSPMRRLRLRRLGSVGAVHSAGGNRYYLDELGWARYRRVRRRRVAVVGIILLIIAVLFVGFESCHSPGAA